AVLRVSAADFLRPASVRLEHGREDPDAYYEGWLDETALRREVLGPLAAGRPVLPRLWNTATDRSWRAAREPVGEPGVVLLDGPLLLGRGLSFAVTVHLALSPGALARRTPEALRWTLPAFARYAAEVDPEAVADVVVRWDHPPHPAVRVTNARATAG
ncbi:MAG TPA: uridine kinase, partial [Pseudonocardiaceae bacterium]